MKAAIQNKVKRQSAAKVMAIAIWGIVIVSLFFNRDKISIEEIASLTPANMTLAVLLFLLLFALKSITVVVYCGILYAASGVIFPLYLALPVSLAGTAVMITIPFFIGKRLRNDDLRALCQKHPRLNNIRTYTSQNDFLFAFFTRIVGMLPSDLVSAYMGAMGMDFRNYLFGSLLGMTPGVVIFTVMGMSVDDPTSPAFLISLASEATLTIAALVFIKIKNKKNTKEKSSCQRV